MTMPTAGAWLLVSYAAILSLVVNAQIPGCEDSPICETYLPAACLENDLIKMSCPSLCGECTIAPRYTLTDWTPWGACTGPIRSGQFIRARYRRCIDPSTSSDAPHIAYCPDESGLGGVQQQPCGPTTAAPSPAPTQSPQWSQWTDFSACSATCGAGQSFRTRTCPAQNECDDPRDLGSFQIQSCNLGPCSQWTQWSDYSECSTTCGPGASFRTRRCPSPNACTDPGNIGPFQSQPCNLGPCVLAVPSSWTPCSKTCGGGRRSRQNCFGTSCTTVFQDCNTQRCIQSGRQDIEYVAKTFFRSVTAVSSWIWSRRTCPGDYESSDKSVKMFSSPCPNRRAKRQVPDRTYTPKSKRDVVFLIDESASVGTINFRRFVKLAQTLVDKAFCGNNDVGQDKTRVGVVSFDSQHHLHMDLRASFAKTNLLHGLQNVNFNFTTSGFTCIGSTLQYVRQNVLTVGRGARVNDGDTEQVLIILSDGCTYCMSPDRQASDVRLAAEEFKKNGVVVITFLVGSHSDECINEMKSLIDGTRCYQLFEFKDWNEVDVAISTLEAEECPNDWQLSQC